MVRSPGIGNAFTLIELLIVVAIISILASIAVPNFTEAQVRAKVARIQADMRTIVTGLESYMVDNNAYPVRHHTGGRDLPLLTNKAEQMSHLTTPISYLSSLPVDIFARNYPFPNDGIDYWDARQIQQFLAPIYATTRPEEVADFGYALVSVGPDGVIGTTARYADYPGQGQALRTLYQIYDPTNGTVSFGNIFKFQGERNPNQIIVHKYTR
jgi:type II secretion system protein G